MCQLETVAGTVDGHHSFDGDTDLWIDVATLVLAQGVDESQRIRSAKDISVPHYAEETAIPHGLPGRCSAAVKSNRKVRLLFPRAVEVLIDGRAERGSKFWRFDHLVHVFR